MCPCGKDDGANHLNLPEWEVLTLLEGEGQAQDIQTHTHTQTLLVISRDSLSLLFTYTTPCTHESFEQLVVILEW